jgi:hypothetical protein
MVQHRLHIGGGTRQAPIDALRGQQHQTFDAVGLAHGLQWRLQSGMVGQAHKLVKRCGAKLRAVMTL